MQSLDYALPLDTVTQEETTIPIRLTGKVSSLKQIEALKLKSAGTQGMGAPASEQPGGAANGAILLSDIAEIKTVTTKEQFTRYNGEPSFVVEVINDQDANTADVSDEVKALLASYEDKGERRDRRHECGSSCWTGSMAWKRRKAKEIESF
ncbi:hypothetical protein [Cohnella nanjingensis]|uniref:Efflux RND transporter permease subunit n=1 Tax=Cohnella nanjingensis TaxID=1387779 RepID=A0A7X0RTR7_9BACL|nr:hypothetical protein [Cohnella nanjingensis]MBB6673529.1 efflux RND transporter permease subunit [Cohnella nanjingensis]